MTWNQGIFLEAFDVGDHAVLSEDLGYGDRVERVLQKEPNGMSVKDLAEYLAINKVDSLEAQLIKDERFVVDGDLWRISSDNLTF